MTSLERKRVRLALILTLVLAALGALAYATDAQAGRGPEEYDVTDRYCSHPIVMLGNKPYPGPVGSPNMLSLPSQRGPIMPPWAPGNSPKLATFVWGSYAIAKLHIRSMRQAGYQVHRSGVWCSSFFAYDEHNARLKWHILGVAGVAPEYVLREDWTHCRMTQARFPNIVHPGGIKCSKKWHVVITRLPED